MIRLKEIRKQEGISQEEIAKFLNITQSAYSNYENDNREPDYKTLVKLSEYFDVSIDYLFGLSSSPKSIDKNDCVLTQEELQMVERLRKIKPDKMKAWFVLLEN